MSVFGTVYVSVFGTVYVSVCVTVYVSVFGTVYVSVCVTVYVSICVTVCAHMSFPYEILCATAFSLCPREWVEWCLVRCEQKFHMQGLPQSPACTKREIFMPISIPYLGNNSVFILQLF